jgi:hypothetical protein
MSLEETLSCLEQVRVQNALDVNRCFSIPELRGFATCSGILPGPPRVPSAKEMKLIVFADSTCNVYPGGNTLKSYMWKRGWDFYDQKGGPGLCLGALAKQLRDYIVAENAKTKTAHLAEDTCIVVVWNGNDFDTARYKSGYSGGLQPPELEQLKYLVGLAKLCPRFTVISTTDHKAWNLGPLFAKRMAQALGFLQHHGVNVVPFDSFIARTRPYIVHGNPMHLTKAV